MKLFDLHADIGYDVMQKRRLGKTNILNEYHLDKFKQGEIAYVCMASYFEGSETWADMQDMVIALKEEVALCEEIDLVLTKSDLIENGHIKAILSIEGMCGIKDNPEEKIQWLYEQGIRLASFCWNDENALATGVKGNEKRGLTEVGHRALREMIKLNMIIDVSHANEVTFWDIAKEQDVRMIATHSNVRLLCNHPRNLWNEQIGKIKMLHGVVGVVSAPFFVHENKEKQDIAHLVNHIRYICDEFGVENVAFGFDYMDFYDGYDNFHTKDLKDCRNSQNVISEMYRRGFSEREIRLISHENALRVIKEVL